MEGELCRWWRLTFAFCLFQLSINVYDYNCHVDLIRLLRLEGELTKVRMARQKMSEIFPLTEGKGAPAASVPRWAVRLSEIGPLGVGARNPSVRADRNSSGIESPEFPRACLCRQREGRVLGPRGPLSGGRRWHSRGRCLAELWLEWLHDEISMALDGLDREHVYDLFEKAVKDYICK